MKFVYSKGGKFCRSTFVGLPEIALANGYVEVNDEDYEALCMHEKCWENGGLVDYTKTAEEIAREQQRANRQKIAELKENLTRTTTEAIMYAEGILTEEQYAPIKAQRQAWQDEINALQNV